MAVTILAKVFESHHDHESWQHYVKKGQKR